jgi:hypothetical protein
VVKASGSYSVDVIDSIGCVGTSATAVNVDVHALPQAEISGEPQICQDAEATYSVEGDSTHIYIWKVKGAMGAITKGQGTNNISVHWADSGMASVSVIVRDTASSCVASDTLAVLVGRPFTPVITGGGSSMCAGDSMTLDAGEGYARYRWSTGDTTRTISVMGKGKYEVTVWNAGGCVGSAKLTIDRIFAAPKPSLSVIGTAKYPGDTLLLAVLPDGYLRYSWHKNGEWMTKDTTRFFTARENGVYNVEVTDSNGCHGSAEVYLDMWKVPTTIISIPKIEASPGQFVELPLQLSGHNLNPNESRSFTATIRYNGTMLMPADTTPLGVMDPVTFERVLTIQGVNRGGMDDSTVTLSMMHFQVMLGDTDFTDLKIESFAWADTNIKVTDKLDGMVHLDKVCREGVQARYIRPGGQFALKPVQPNPVDGAAKISFSVLEIGTLHLDVADLKGNVVATLADGEYKQGDYDVTFNTSDLPTGTYLLRLQTATGVRTNELIVKH